MTEGVHYICASLHINMIQVVVAIALSAVTVASFLFIVGIDSMQYNQERISFNDTYKILQISDAQIRRMGERCQNIDTEWQCDAWNTTALVHSLVAVEQPDLVIFTGDNVRGYNNRQAWKVLENLLPNVPFALVTGNHDRMTIPMTIPQMYRKIRQSFPSALLGNTQLVLTSETSEYQLFIFDHAYTRSGWAPVLRRQIQWYERIRHAMPTLIFNHIPLRQYKNVSSVVGTRRESVSYANEDTFWAHAENVLVFSVGHDHRNDFCGKYEASWLCYAGSVGYTTYGYTGWNRRARVFVLNQTGVLTYKRLDDMSIQDTQFFST